MRPQRASVAVGVVAVGAVAVAVAMGACGNRAPEHKERPRETERARRVIEPSTDRVGPLPPYAIRADGVGPYKLGEKLSDLLEQLASGPRIALFEIPGVVHRNVIRTEDDAILVGGEQASTASFVAVVGADVARTESGLHVGSTRDELVGALGPPLVEPTRARDPRLVVPRGQPSLRVVLDGARVVAIVVAAPSPPAPAVAPPAKAADCERPAAAGKAFGACLTAAGELVELAGEELVVHAADGERALAPALRLPGAVFAAPMRRPSEPRDELVVITRTDEPTVRSWSISAYRLEATRLVRALEPTPLYQLSVANARWIGAELGDVELYLELTSGPESIEVGGLLSTLRIAKTGARTGDVVVIAGASVPRRRVRPTPVDPEAKAAAPSAPRSAEPDADTAGPPAAPADSSTSAPP